MLVYPKEGELHLLLNKRSESVEDHKGEVSFPGGRMDDGDGSLLDTALREAHEEVGVRPEDVRVIRRLDDVETSTGYRVTPFLGAIPGGYPFVVSTVEVAALVEVPVAALVDGSTVRDETRFEDGVPVSRPNYAWRRPPHLGRNRAHRHRPAGAAALRRRRGPAVRAGARMNPKTREQLDLIGQRLEAARPGLLDEVLPAIEAVSAELQDKQVVEWAEKGAVMAEQSVRSWEAAARFYAVSPAVARMMPFNYFLKWADCGSELCAESPTLAVSYFAASPGAMSRLRSRHIETWMNMGRGLYRGSWKSSTLSTKFFEASPALLGTLTVPELERFTGFLGRALKPLLRHGGGMPRCLPGDIPPARRGQAHLHPPGRLPHGDDLAPGEGPVRVIRAGASPTSRPTSAPGSSASPRDSTTPG